ncbi:hypothetical protein CKA32_005639 [Geitlerinema sp. FC II]|nr:hypothetical protein CKA32_005639 [Geitlerinema sp. FC II]
MSDVVQFLKPQRCVTISRSHDRHPIFQVTHPCMLAVYVVGA